MGNEEGGEASTNDSVTMEDLKGVEASLRISMETELRAMREMIAQLLPANKTSTPPPPEDPASTLRDKASARPGEEKVEDENTLESPSSKKKGGKEDYSEVPHWYSPDPPIPHPHINNRGDPPKLNASSFMS